MRLLRITIAATLVVGGVPWMAFANQSGTSTATFLQIGQGARAEGMGGAFTAVANDAYAVYWNPAGLAQITRMEVGLNHLQFIEKINSQYASFVAPVNKLNASVGVGATYVDMGTIDRRDAAGNPESGDNKATAYAGTLGWGQAVGSRLALGVSAKYFAQNLAGNTGAGLAADLGLLYFAVQNRLALGATALNVGPKIKTGTTNEDIPRSYTGGLAFYAIPDQLVFALDAQKERDTAVVMHVGGEYTFQRRFIVRAGYQDTKEAGGGLSAGFGYIWRPHEDSSSSDFFGQQDNNAHHADQGLDIRIDYSYVDMGDFDATHRIGVHLAF